MKIVMMATGGVGGYYGARLAAVDEDVRFIARGPHQELDGANPKQCAFCARVGKSASRPSLCSRPMGR
jgi:hypothetical protein